MHDIIFAKNIIDLLKEKAAGHCHQRITVNITLGPFTHVTEQSLRSAFALLNEEAGFKGVFLNIRKNKARIKCNKCKVSSDINAPINTCPLCGADDFELINNEEFIIDSLEIE